ncbi:MAG: alpha-methylacyl-CoA racemase [Saprospiraceae bacterium]|jgi:alpha-methylacyl-CoA racemase
MGPLKGIRILEIGGIGPGPFAGMMLADMGAEVICVERKSDPSKTRMPDCSRRGKRSIAINLKTEDGVETLLKLVEKADVIFEGFRPGVMERLGIGPDICLDRNPKIIFGRMTGWGQTGPLSHAAGHDINYISLTGALYAMGRSNENPVPPLNLVGDYGGGAMFLVTGILAALIEVQKSGKGQVIDAAMTDGSAVLMAMFNSLNAIGMWTTKRGVNFLDSGAHFYETYKTQDDKYISIGSIEPQFYALLIEKAGLDKEQFGSQLDQRKWPDMKKALADVILRKTQIEWCDILEGTDVCFAPVLDYIEAQSHPHNVARSTYIDVDGMTQPAPAPRFSRTESEVQFGARAAGENTVEVLKDWGFSESEVGYLKGSLSIS